MEKKITLTLVENNLLMTKHLQQNGNVQLNIEGLSPLDADNILLSSATQLLASVTKQIHDSNTKNPVKVTNIFYADLKDK